MVKGRWGKMQDQYVHELIMLTLSKCSFMNEDGNEVDLGREIYQKYMAIQTAIVTEVGKPKSK